MHAQADELALDGRIISVLGHNCINFGSCSYLGLEVDSRLKRGAIAAIERYGVHFSASRGTISAPPYATVEAQLSEIFGVPTLLAPSTSLAHIAALPVIAQEDDAFIIDQQAHHSLQTASQLLRASHVELIRHSRMDLLEERVLALRDRYKRIWYVADSIYSMLGDAAPLAHVRALMERYKPLHLYIDDAHGTGWCGQRGRGFALEHLPLDPRLVVATSLGKGFGVGGGALIIPDPELRSRVRTIGGPFIFSGPLQPPLLGAAAEAAKIFLSDELTTMQAGIQQRIRLANALLREANLPVVTPDDTPIRFVATGLPKVTLNLGERLLRAGFYLLAAHFPVVPMKRSGLRFTLTLHHTDEDIRRLVAAIAHHLPLALEEEGYDLASVRRAFDLPTEGVAIGPPGSLTEAELVVPGRTLELTVSPPELQLEHVRSIDAVPQQSWDALFRDRGSFTWQGLQFLEALFANRTLPEHQWKFHYFLVRDRAQKIVLATFFTESLWKEDMIARADVSKLLEERRKADPYFLATRNLSMGSLLTEGNHLYLDKSADWQSALRLLLERVNELHELSGTHAISLRDLPDDDKELETFLCGRGFAKLQMPPSHELALDWSNEEAFLATLSKGSRMHQRKEVRPWDGAYEVEILDHTAEKLSSPDLTYLHRLYQNVQQRALQLNTFPLPDDYFARVLAQPGWELVMLRLLPEAGGPADGRPVAIAACFKGTKQYVPVACGLDYDYVYSHRAYRQLLRHLVRRAKALGMSSVGLGIGASIEKLRFGARPSSTALYVQASDHYQMEIIARMMEDGRATAT